MAKKGSGTGVGVGGSSILVIFILLCLTTFATLSMVSAQADLRLTEKMAFAAREYYDADARAELVLAEIDEILVARGSRAGDSQALLAACGQEIRESVENATVEQSAGNPTMAVRYWVPVNDNQQLTVELEVAPNAAGQPHYARKKWAVDLVGDWEPEPGGFDLWGGGEELFSGDGLPDLS